MNEIKSTSSLIGRLRAVLLKQRLVLFSAGLVGTVTVVVGIWVLLSLLAHVMVLPVWLKVGLLVISGLASLWVFWKHAVVRLFSGDVDGVAVRLEEKNPDLKGRLIAAVQFARMKTTPGYSRELIEANERQALSEAGLVRFNEVISFYPLWRFVRLLAGAAVVAVLLLVLMPGFFSYSYEVYSKATTRVAPPLSYEVVPIPESGEWVKYRDIEIGAAVFGWRLPQNATVHYRFAGGQWQKTRVDLRSKPIVSRAGGDSLAFGVMLRQVNKSFDYYVEAGRVSSEIQRIDVVDRPRVNQIKLAVFYPDYTGLPPTTIEENNGSFSAVVGSRANLRIGANLPVTQAELVFDDSSRTPLKITGKTGETSLRIEKSRVYYIELVDHLGETNPDPIEYHITAVPDEYPSVEVLYPGFNANLSDEMMIPFKVHIYDDYGFSSLALKYQVVTGGEASDENVAVIHYPETIKTEGEVSFNWDLSSFALYPGDYVTYYFEVADNDRITGPKVSRSRQYIARLPSLDEMISQTEQENQQRIVDTESMVKSGKDLARRLQEAVRKLEAETQASRKADWQQQKELEAIAEKNLDMLDQIEKMAEQMQSSLEQLNENSLMSRQIMEKLQEIQKLFEEVATPEMREAQKRLMEALKKMDPKEMQEALKDFQLSQEDLMERLERTLALLKRMQVEQKMEAMIRQAEQLVEQQTKMNEKTDASSAEQLPQYSKSEDDIRAALEQLKDQVAELKQLLEEAGMQESSEAQKFAEAVESTDADKNMKQMSGAMQKEQKESAMSEGDQALSKLFEMLDEMQQQQAAMQGGDSEKMQRALRRAADDANYLSINQEDLLDEVSDLGPRSQVIRDLAAPQQDVQSACNGLRRTIEELGQASPFVAAELMILMDRAGASMDMSVELLDSRRGAAAMQQQREAMAILNKVSLRLMESLDRQQQCQNPRQCNSPIPKHESMCNKQQMLNNETQKMCNNPKMSSEAKQQMRVGMERLAGEQASIRKSIEELEREFGQSRQILGRLDDIASEMKKVEEALASGEAGQETTERQLKIFSRMLEATRSMQRKDYTEQRQATSAENDVFYVPPSLSSEMLEGQGDIEDRLQRYLGDEYPAQYEEQIKAYFRALLQLQYQTQPQGR